MFLQVSEWEGEVFARFLRRESLRQRICAAVEE
jgi:hypothetical protein